MTQKWTLINMNKFYWPIRVRTIHHFYQVSFAQFNFIKVTSYAILGSFGPCFCIKSLVWQESRRMESKLRRGLTYFSIPLLLPCHFGVMLAHQTAIWNEGLSPSKCNTLFRGGSWNGDGRCWNGKKEQEACPIWWLLLQLCPTQYRWCHQCGKSTMAWHRTEQLACNQELNISPNNSWC